MIKYMIGDSMNNKEKFINTYENIIKPLREDYYKNKVKQGLVDNVFNKSLFIINLAPIIIAIFLCTLGQFTLKSTIIHIKTALGRQLDA